ncbi:hypothetical protein ACWCV9_36940 [Streptomyces sp. NPDC001606]
MTFTRTLAAELTGSPVTVQVLCPGLTATEWRVRSRQEKVHDDGGMPPEDVVDASLVALRDGETVCVPGLGNPAAVDTLAAAEGALRAGSRGSRIAARYRQQGTAAY